MVSPVSLVLEDVDVDFPIYQSSARSLKQIALQTAVGGRIRRAGQSGRTLVQALRGIGLALRPGDRLALIGHNGSGKTTLLRVMAGIYHPTRGHVRVVGHRAALCDIQVGQDDEATGYESILLRGLMMGRSRSEIDERAKDIANFSGLGEYLHLPIRTYSSGMVLRLYFSIATSVSTDILLMDEWIASGDAEFAEKANHRLQSLIDRAHILVIASHDQSLLRKLCNRAVLLESGQIVTEGAVETVFAEYTERLTSHRPTDSKVAISASSES